MLFLVRIKNYLGQKEKSRIALEVEESLIHRVAYLKVLKVKSPLTL